MFFHLHNSKLFCLGCTLLPVISVSGLTGILIDWRGFMLFPFYSRAMILCIILETYYLYRTNLMRLIFRNGNDGSESTYILLFFNRSYHFGINIMITIYIIISHIWDKLYLILYLYYHLNFKITCLMGIKCCSMLL